MNLARFTPEPWMADALCAQTDSEVFFPEKGGSTREAKAICAKCPAIAACRAFAIEHHELGVWGGLSEQQRKNLRRQEAA